MYLEPVELYFHFYLALVQIFIYLPTGEVGHSNLRRPECLSEKRLKEADLSRRIESLKKEISSRTRVRQSIMLLNEQVGDHPLQLIVLVWVLLHSSFKRILFKWPHKLDWCLHHQCSWRSQETGKEGSVSAHP